MAAGVVSPPPLSRLHLHRRGLETAGAPMSVNIEARVYGAGRSASLSLRMVPRCVPDLTDPVPGTQWSGRGAARQTDEDDGP